MFITPAFAQGSLFGGAGGEGGMLVSLLPFALIFVIMYFLILRPQQKRVKQHQEMVKNVRRGDTVITNGGLIGKVYITGLGLPSEMKDYVLKGACDTFAIWNPVDYGYSSTYIMNDILSGKPTTEGSKLSMGKKGETTVGKDGECVMGEPFVFDKSNVEEYAKIF